MRHPKLPPAADILTLAVYLGLVAATMLVLHSLIHTLPVHIVGYVIIAMVAFAFGMTAGERSALLGTRTVKAARRRQRRE